MTRNEAIDFSLGQVSILFIGLENGYKPHMN